MGLTSVLGVGLAAAHSQQGAGQDKLVDKIAQKFNLKRDDVQKVFDENRAEHEKQHQERVKTKLDQAVKDGKITQDQENKILAKLDELQKDRESMKGKSTQEHKAAMEKKKAELDQWAKDNNIPEDFLREVLRPRGKRPHQ